MHNYESCHIDIDGNKIPVRLYKEWRNSLRFSVGKKYLIVRYPSLLGSLSKKVYLLKLKLWFQQQVDRNPEIIQRFIIHQYTSGEEISILEEQYTILFNEEDRKTMSWAFEGQSIRIKLPKGLSNEVKNKNVQKLLIKAFTKRYKPYIDQRVFDLNKEYFNERIESIKLKYNSSNWGSCSSKRNINLSSRLLLAPKSVVDYVIVHELSHLKEMNHSRKFWSIVRKVMPDYEKKEEWLKKFGHSCYF